MACDDNGCGAVGDACFEPQGTRTETKWTYVGAGRGGYEKMQTYKHVGDGHGAFDKQMEARSTMGGTMSKCCKTMVVLLVLGGIAYCVSKYLVTTGGLHPVVPPFATNAQMLLKQPTASPKPAVQTGPIAEPFDCKEHLETWQTTWTSEKKDWCCDRYTVGCPIRPGPVKPGATPAPVVAPPTSAPYDCVAGFANWQKGWSPVKKEWCCKNLGKACEGTDETYNCNEGYAHWQTAWSPVKKSWCCEHNRVGCVAVTPPFAPATTQAYDCKDGIEQAALEWAIPKKSWCCVHKGIACPSAAANIPAVETAVATPAPVAKPPAQEVSAAQAGMEACDHECVANGQVATCKTRLLWLAKTDKKDEANPCEAAQQEMLHQCSTDCGGCTAAAAACAVPPRAAGAPAAMPPAVKPSPTAAVLPPVPPPSGQPSDFHDCMAGYETWQANWSDAKKDWCCHSFGRGCDPKTSQASTPVEYDCNAGLVNWRLGWSDEKKTWCCTHHNQGCPDGVKPMEPAAGQPPPPARR